MSRLYEALNNITSRVTAEAYVRSGYKESAAQTINAGVTQTFTLDITKSGYTPIALARLQTSITGYTCIVGWNIVDTTLNVYIRNLSSSSQSVKAVADILYVKTS